ncbi:MAG: DUF4062 domain-containing protein [Balneola sp.]
MIPNIFVSSTIVDLQHLRDAVRETIADLGYNPILSEYGDIGYLPDLDVQDSCYSSLKDAQICVLIVGKRYGSITDNDLSVTHNEFLTAKDVEVPIITLVDREVLTYQRVYNANKDSQPNFPGMDNPRETFNFLREITESNLNNGILSFSNATEARNHFKKQLAHLFGDLLRKRFDPLDSQIKDVLSEIKTLRHDLVRKPKDESLKYLRATRFLLSDKNNIDKFRVFINKTVGSIDTSVPILIKSKTFDEFLEKSEIEIDIVEHKEVHPEEEERDRALFMSYFLAGPMDIENQDNDAAYSVFIDKHVRMNNTAKNWFDNTYEKLRIHIESGAS